MHLYNLIWIIILSIIIGITAGLYLGSKKYKTRSSISLDDKAAYIKGLQYIISHQPDKAIAEFTRAVQISSGTAEIYLNLGNLFREKGEVERALRIHQSILLRPSLTSETKSSALLELGRDYAIAGFIDRAIGVFKEVIKFHPNMLEAHHQLEKLYEEEKNWDKALDTLKYIEKLSKKDQSITVSHIICEKAKERINSKESNSQAIKELKQAISLNKECTEAYIVLGDIYFDEDSINEAISTWEKVIHIDLPFSHLVYKNLEKAYLKKGIYDQIANVYQQKLEKHQDDISTRIILADYYQKKGVINKAIQLLREGHKINPKSTLINWHLGEILIKDKRDTEIIKEYQLLLDQMKEKNLTYYICTKCGYQNSEVIWKCPQCKEWDTFTPKN